MNHTLLQPCNVLPALRPAPGEVAGVGLLALLLLLLHCVLDLLTYIYGDLQILALG